MDERSAAVVGAIIGTLIGWLFAERRDQSREIADLKRKARDRKDDDE